MADGMVTHLHYYFWCPNPSDSKPGGGGETSPQPSPERESGNNTLKNSWRWLNGCSSPMILEAEESRKKQV